MAGGQVDDHPIDTLDLTATLIDAGGAAPDERFPLDGVDLLPWLVDGAGFPEHDLFWRISNQGAVRRGRFKYLYDRRDRSVLGNWPRREGESHLLYDLTVDGREQADIADHQSQVLEELRETWARTDAHLLPYPPTHPGLPQPSPTAQTSEPD